MCIAPEQDLCHDVTFRLKSSDDQTDQNVDSHVKVCNRSIFRSVLNFGLLVSMVRRSFGEASAGVLALVVDRGKCW
jgi:hypothetical protein